LGPAFIWISVAALVGAIFAELLGWHGVRTAILIAWVVFVLLVAMTRGMRWTSALTYLSAAALLGAVGSQLFGAIEARIWFLLAWAVLLLPVSIGLASHPMRAPAWGVFVGFWGVVGALWLIVLQSLSVAGFLVASSLGFGAEGFPRWVDLFGILAGIGLILLSLSNWVDASDQMTRAAGSFSAVAYVFWAIGLGWVLWGTQQVSHRFRGIAAERVA
jgi:hypothetical protein